MDLISRQALLEEYDRVHIGPPGKARELIENAPTIEEQKTGKWISTDDGWDGEYFVCSVCGFPCVFTKRSPDDNGPNFCPNCGADMRGEQDG